MDDWQRASALLDRFETAGIALPAEADKLVAEVFRACGMPVTNTGFVESDSGADLFIEGAIDGVSQRIAVEVVYRASKAGRASVEQLLSMRAHPMVNRAIIVSRSGFTEEAKHFALTRGVGAIDLISPADLRNWLAKHRPHFTPDMPVELLLRTAMRAVARRIAIEPGELEKLDWLELEKVLREVFEGIGFEATRTRPAKDGGFDLELTTTTDGMKATYLVEVKHWSEDKPGPKHLDKLIHVTASREASAGLLLSTSGFTKTLYEGLTEVKAPVRIGDGSKIVSLCKTYYRIQSALWIEDRHLQDVLFEGTSGPPEPRLNA
jgi:HJR/Mrr/RecB family endonuclease